MLKLSMIAEKRAADDFGRDQQPVGTPMWKLLVDPYIAIIAGALVGLVAKFSKEFHVFFWPLFFKYE